MTTYKEIVQKLKSNGIDVSSGDSDESTAIVYGAKQEEIKEALKGLNFTLHSGYQGIVIAPKE
jgi:hypothetical protein